MDNKLVSILKMLSIDMIDSAGSGYPGVNLSSAAIIYAIYAKHMNINVNDSKWISRDRFVLSEGYASSALYAMLHLIGYDISMDDLKKYRRKGFKTPALPDMRITPGIDMSSGLPGEGLASAVGMALGEKIMETKFVIPRDNSSLGGKSLINYNIYSLVSERDLMQGISYEAASLAGALNLDNLIVLYDSNNISFDGDISDTFTDNICDRFKALGWHTSKVSKGNNPNEIDKAIEDAKKSGKPSLIEVKTVLGIGSVIQGTVDCYSKPLDKDDVKQLRNSLELPDSTYYYDPEATKVLREKITERSSRKYEMWSRLYNEYKKNIHPQKEIELNKLFRGSEIDLINYTWHFDKEEKVSTIRSNYDIMQEIEKIADELIGGSSDYVNITKTKFRSAKDIKDEHFDGKNIDFGSRERAMGAILNGLAVSGFKAFGSTLLASSDLVKPSIRMSALMSLPVNYIFTHDACSNIQDGPVYQPVEELVGLRSIPNLNVFRPADAKEIVGAWNVMLNANKPNALVLSSHEVPLIPTTNSDYVKYGAYPVRSEQNKLHGVIIATGTEVKTAITIAEQLYSEKGLDLRVVSMPSKELFEMQNDNYKASLLPQGYKTVVIEAGSSYSWFKYVYNEKYLVTIDRFGISGTKSETEKELEYSFENIKEKVSKIFS